MLKTNKLKLSKRQSQDGGFLPLLLGALGSLAAQVLGSLFGKGLQVDAQQMVPRGRASSGCATKAIQKGAASKKKKLSQ